MAGLRLSRTQAAFDIEQQADGTSHVRVPHGDGSILVRPLLPGESLLPTFRLAYEIYVNERGLVARDALPVEQQAMQAKWDRWDDPPTTRHFVAVHEGNVVGHMRVVGDSPLGLPMEHFGFDLTAHRRWGQEVREISKLMIARPYRGGGIMAALYWHVFQSCHVQQGLQSVYLSCERVLTTLYGRSIGAAEIGQFVHRETSSMFAAMRVDFVGSYERQFDATYRAEVGRRREAGLAGTPQLVSTAA
ncbi:MAG: GNAT family N-acetyltransferase [Gemmatirosa sp.]